jgi:putative endonuclease
MRTYYVYIVASKSRRLYVGVTRNLERRVYEHRTGLGTFTSQYRINRLVHFEEFSHAIEAIEREKRIKSFLRARKIDLIESKNPTWDDLADSWYPHASWKPGGTA